MTTTNVWLPAAANLFLIITMAAATPSRNADLDEKPFDKLSDQAISEWGQKALAVNATKWKHGETEHFVIHFFRSGDMIARRSEKFYAEIRAFFGNRADKMQGRKSHIFAFCESDDWETFKRAVDKKKNVAGVTRGNEFFYMAFGEEKQFDYRGHVQAHEMTHLVFNRFFTGHLPLWLNEGVAEYFGLKKTLDTATFRRTLSRAKPFGLERLFKTNEYPKTEDEVHSFYAEATIVVDFLTQTADRRGLLTKFIDALIEDPDVDKALVLYGYKSREEFSKAYERHCSLFVGRRNK